MKCSLCGKEVNESIHEEYCSNLCWEYSDIAEKVKFSIPDRKKEGRYIASINGKICFPTFPVTKPEVHIVTLEDKGNYFFAHRAYEIDTDQTVTEMEENDYEERLLR